MHSPQKQSSTLKSPAFVFLTVALSVFFAETLIMLLLHFLPQQSLLTEAIIDAALLVTLISPTLYYFLFKPMVTHISERQQVEEMLLKNKEQQFKTMIRASLDSFWITNLQGRFVEVNNAYCQLMGYSQEELLHMGIADVKVTDDTQDISRNINRIIEKGSDRFETRHRCKRWTHTGLYGQRQL